MEFEQLLSEKAGLEQEARDLEEEKKQVETRAKVLCQKIIQELKNKNHAKRESINQLQSKVDNLEAQLDKLSGSGVLERAGVATSENAENKDDTEKALEASEENVSETTVIVTALDKEELNENSKAEQERKKHLFF